MKAFLTVASARKPSRGFSLIELLVVVSIIALLVSLLLPALSKAKQQSTQVTCGMNLKSLGQGLKMYLSEFDETYPVNGTLLPKAGGNVSAPTIGYGNGRIDNGTSTISNGVPQAWDLPYGQLWTYMSQNRKLYVCPQDDLARYKNQQLVRGDNGAISYIGGPAVSQPKGITSYSINSITNSEGQFRQRFLPHGAPSATVNQPWHDPLRSNTINRETDFIVFVEESNGPGGLSSNFNDEVFDPPAYNQGDYMTTRHNNGGNVGFGDGHVEWFSEVVFDNVPPAVLAGVPSNWNAMQSPVTRMFFPDGGGFANPSN